MWSGGNESAKFWLSVMNDLKYKGVNDVLISCIDALTGFTNAIFPKTEIQQCIRNTTRFVICKDIKALIADLKRVYAAVDEDTTLAELNHFDEILGHKYPKIADNGRSKWAHLSTYFKYP